MKIRVEIKLFGSDTQARLYAVRLLGQEKPEVARFFDRVISGEYDQKNKNTRKALSSIVDWLDRIARLDGVQERFFRPREGRGLALPIDKGPLRLYCYRFDNENLLLCGGGLKEGETIQESPDCMPHFEIMNSVISELKRRRITGAELPADTVSTLFLDIVAPDTYESAR